MFGFYTRLPHTHLFGHSCDFTCWVIGVFMFKIVHAVSQLACDYTVEVTSLCLSCNHVSGFSSWQYTSICSCRKCFFLLLPLCSGGDHLDGEMLSTFSLSLLMGVEVTKPLPLMPLPLDSGSEFGLDMIREFEAEQCSEVLRMLTEVLSGLLRNIDGEKVSCFNFDGDFSTEDGDRNPTLRVVDSSPGCLRSE